MRLESRLGHSIELLADGYEYPEGEDHWDANWLWIRGQVEHPHGSWAFRDACFTTFELDRLADWLDEVRSGNAAADSEQEFAEPSLVFTYVDRPEAAVRVRIAHSAAPPWLKKEDRFSGVQLFFPVVPDDLIAASRSLRSQLTRFPVRGGPCGRR